MSEFNFEKPSIDTPEFFSQIIEMKFPLEPIDELKKMYNDGLTLRWSYDVERFNLIVWGDYKTVHSKMNPNRQDIHAVGYYSKKEDVVTYTDPDCFDLKMNGQKGRIAYEAIILKLKKSFNPE